MLVAIAYLKSIACSTHFTFTLLKVIMLPFNLFKQRYTTGIVEDDEAEEEADEENDDSLF